MGNLNGWTVKTYFPKDPSDVTGGFAFSVLAFSRRISLT